MRLASLLGLAALTILAAPAAAQGPPAWAMTATLIEACSCPMFCQCFFNTSPATHHAHGGMAGGTYCKGNIAYRVDAGHYYDIDLTGATFWAAGDLGDSFADGEIPWLHVTFDRDTTPQQREGIGFILSQLYPMKVTSMTMGEGEVEWVADEQGAHATLDGGKTAEIILERSGAASGAGPIVIENLTYFGENTNDGFILMPATLEAWHGPGGEDTYEFTDTNGFMITIHINEYGPMMNREEGAILTPGGGRVEGGMGG